MSDPSISIFDKLGGTAIAIVFLCCGILLFYRGLLTPARLKSVTSKIYHPDIDARPGSNGSINYAIAFDVNAWGARYGIDLGSDVSSKDFTIVQSLDTISLYTIVVDTTVPFANGLTPGVRSISLNGQKIFEESVITSIISGTMLFLLALIIFYFAYFKKQESDS